MNIATLDIQIDTVNRSEAAELHGQVTRFNHAILGVVPWKIDYDLRAHSGRLHNLASSPTIPSLKARTETTKMKP
jgi:hypothetical protein